MELKQDVGGVQADVKSLAVSLAAHVEASTQAHARITALEMHNAKIRGAATVWTAVAVAIGTGVGYLAEFLIAVFKDRPHL